MRRAKMKSMGTGFDIPDSAAVNSCQRRYERHRYQVPIYSRKDVVISRTRTASPHIALHWKSDDIFCPELLTAQNTNHSCFKLPSSCHPSVWVHWNTCSWMKGAFQNISDFTLTLKQHEKLLASSSGLVGKLLVLSACEYVSHRNAHCHYHFRQTN